MSADHSGKRTCAFDGRLMLGAGTLFCSAALSFSVQPMMGKMLLPHVGGAPSGWLAALAFFQIVLLAGYALAYALSRLSSLVQFAASVGLLAGGLGFLPPHVGAGIITPGNGYEALAVVGALGAALAVPFVALASLSPSLQRLFNDSASRHAGNPYALFAASNLGSFAGLLSYPFWFERHMGLAQQARLWQTGYAVTLTLAVLWFIVALRDRRRISGQAARDSADDGRESLSRKAVWRQRAEWALLAFLPSSLMMGLTWQIAQEAIYPPYFRILPLAVYLVTLVTAFARKREGWTSRCLRFLQPATAVFVVVNAVAAPYDLGFTLVAPLLGMVAFWPAAALCHNRLAERRPAAARLSEYYLFLAVGGALGGIANAFLVPALFPIPAEFALALLATSWALSPAPVAGQKSFWKTKLFWIAGGGAVIATLFPAWGSLLERGHFAYSLLAALIALLVCARDPRGLAALSILCLALAFAFPAEPRPLAVERNFFGVLRVRDLAGEDGSVYRALYNGATPHTIVKIAPHFGAAPLSAFDETSILGNLARLPRVKKVGIAGFGAGSFMCAFPKGVDFTGIDINPANFSLGAKWFEVFERCAYPKTVTGDARVTLQNDVSARYDLLVFDVFYGTALPMHLLTREAFRVYFDRLAPGGVIAFHVYSPHYDLRQTLGDMAAEFGAKALSRLPALAKPERLWGQADWNPTPWIAMTRDEGKVSALRAMEWQDLPALGFLPMTDDFNDSISLMKDASHAQTH